MTQQTFFVIGRHCPKSKEDGQTIFNYFFKKRIATRKKNKKKLILYAFTRAMTTKNNQNN